MAAISSDDDWFDANSDPVYQEDPRYETRMRDDNPDAPPAPTPGPGPAPAPAPATSPTGDPYGHELNYPGLTNQQRDTYRDEVTGGMIQPYARDKLGRPLSQSELDDAWTIYRNQGGDAYRRYIDARAGSNNTGGGGEGWGFLNAPYGGALPDVGSYPAFSFEDFAAPDPFAPPSSQYVLDNDPGYALRLSQGKQAMEQSAAARGVLNTGGTLQDLVDYGQSFAANEYSNAYGRALDTYRTNFDNALNNYITRFGSALTKYNTNYGTQYMNPYTMNLGQYDRLNANYTGAQDRAFNQRFSVATA